MANFIDAHCHLTDERIFSNLEKEIAEANQFGINYFISSALCQNEFEMMDHPIFLKFGESIKWCAGIHPYYEESAENDFDSLVKLCDEKKIIAVGEIGLDKRKDNSEWQEIMLLRQLDLAKNYDLPVVFHTVRAYYELHKILKNNFPKVRGYLHAFQASSEIFDIFQNYDLAFSINAKLPKDEVVNKILQRGFMLFETDAPYMRPKELEEEHNHLRNLMYTVEKVEKITDINKVKLEIIQRKSFEQIFGDIL
jgi:TatD DNase family protein